MFNLFKKKKYHVINKYRIVPYGEDEWDIESQWYEDGPWESSSGYCTKHKTIEDAKKVIDDWISDRIQRLEKESLTKFRRDTIPPLEYP